MKRGLLRWGAIAGGGIAVIAAFGYWQSLPVEWSVHENVGATGIALSVDARDAGASGGRLTIACREGRIGAEISPVFVQCIGPCDGPGVILTLGQIIETFIYPERASNTGWVAPWAIDRANAKIVREFEDGMTAPGPDNTDSFPVDSEAFIARLLAAKELSMTIGSGRMSFDARRFAEVLPRLRAHCPVRPTGPSSRPGSAR